MKHQTVYTPTGDLSPFAVAMYPSINGGEYQYISNVEKQEGYFFSPTELLELKNRWMSEAWDAGEVNGCNPDSLEQDKETFLNSIKL